MGPKNGCRCRKTIKFPIKVLICFPFLPEDSDFDGDDGDGDPEGGDEARDEDEGDDDHDDGRCQNSLDRLRQDGQVLK